MIGGVAGDRSRLERRLARPAVTQRDSRVGHKQSSGNAYTPTGDRLRAGWVQIGDGIAVDINRHERQHWLSELRYHVGVGQSLEIQVGAGGPLCHGAHPCVTGSGSPSHQPGWPCRVAAAPT